MANPTQITGYIYGATGSALTTGKLYLTLQNDMVVDGKKYAPSQVVFDLANGAPAGYVDVSLMPTVNASPSGITYYVQFDPDPFDTTKPMYAKVGYWENYWNVGTSATTIGSFLPTLRGSALVDYMPGNLPIRVVTTSPTITSADRGGYVILNNSGLTATLPAPSIGFSVTVVSNVSGSQTISPGTGITIKGKGLNKTSGQSISLSCAAGDCVKLVAETTTVWWIVSYQGNWA